jgi:hypothetical protein
MPFDKDPLGDKRENPKYCSYCFSGGKLCYEGSDRKEFQKIVYKAMREHGTNFLLAHIYSFMIRFAPRWKSKK